MNNTEKIKFTNAHIPSGMYLSVDWDNNQPQPHPVVDASLAGCKRDIVASSTERRIPNGMQFHKFKPLKQYQS